MIKTLIIEDEEPASLRLKQLLTGLASDIEIIGIIDTIESAVKWIENHPMPDLIMLDIQLGDGLSFDIFKKTRVDSYVIFTTAYDEYAIKAFELNSIDYLLKPIDETRLSQSLAKFRKLQPLTQSIDIGKLVETIEGKKDKYKKRFVINITSKLKIVDTCDVAFFYSKEKNSFLCTTNNRHYPVEYSLDQIERMVDPELFFRVSRQYIIQYRSINRIDILSKSRIRIGISPDPEEEIMVSSSRTADFRLWLDR